MGAGGRAGSFGSPPHGPCADILCDPVTAAMDGVVGVGVGGAQAPARWRCLERAVWRGAVWRWGL